MPTKLENLWSGPGRLIMGSLTEKGDKDAKGQPIPEDKQRFFFGVAIPKSDPNFNDLWTKLFTMAATDYGNTPLVMNQIQQGLAAPQFAWKIDDGDAPNYDRNTGQIRPTPEYKKGCWILKFSTSFPVSCCDNMNRDISAADIKRGDYVDVIFNSTVNENVDHTAGIYLNPVAVRRLGFGEPIAGMAPASSVFGQAPAAVLPPGASAMPTAGGPPPLPPGASVAPGNYAPAPVQTAPVVMPGMAVPVGAPAPTAYPTTPQMPGMAPVSAGAPPVPPVTAGTPTLPPPYPGVMGR